MKGLLRDDLIIDPETGLAYCGCGSKAEVSFDGFSSDCDGIECNTYIVECAECGIRTQPYLTWEEHAITAWNKAMGLTKGDYE